MLYGGSWASTLIVAYAQRHPERVAGIILVGVTMSRPQEIDWLYRGLRQLRLSNGNDSALACQSMTATAAIDAIGDLTAVGPAAS